ncbi:MAG TPA: glycosyltransferase family 4 protein, partial [Candidatus Obscuribacterales bacterium]
LRIVHFAQSEPGLAKRQHLLHHYRAATEAVVANGPFDLVHSQHLPVSGADVVTFHNHTTRHMRTVGTLAENLFNQAKSALVPAYRLRREFDRMLCHQARCLVFPSRRCRDDYYCTFGTAGELDGTPSVVAYPGCDPETPDWAKYPVSEETGRQEPLTFLFVGKGHRTKGLNILLAACRILLARQRSFRLLVAGMSSNSFVRASLDLAGLKQHVRYLGYQSDLDSAFRQAVVFVMPSRMETFGIACLQAMQRGLAPVVSRAAGISELLTHDENALLLDDHLDARMLASLMERLIDDRKLLLRLRNSARDLAARLTWKATAEATLEAYRLAMSSKSNRTGAEFGPATAR